MRCGETELAESEGRTISLELSLTNDDLPPLDPVDFVDRLDTTLAVPLTYRLFLE